MPDPPRLSYADRDTQPRFWEPHIGWPLFVIGCIGAACLLIVMLLLLAMALVS
jgi:hypothetical protein